MMKPGSPRVAGRRKPLLYGTILGPETELDGTLSFGESLCIRGIFSGCLESAGYLTIDEGAEIRVRSLSAGAVSVAGALRGDIRVAGRAVLGPSSILEGTMRAAEIEIADGARIDGRIETPFPEI